MSYIQGTDFISSTTEVRKLARSVITADFSDDQIKAYQYKVYSIIRTMTDKDDWNSTNREFGALQLIETEMAAEMIRKHYGKNSEAVGAAEANISSLFGELKIIVDNLDTTISVAGGGKIRKTSYKSWNLNTEVEIPRRGLTIT